MAEVKVKITAANETQTGFQSVLADAQKTAAQVQQTFARASEGPRIPRTNRPQPSGGPIDIDIGDYGLEPLRELQQQLRQAREASQKAFDPQPPQQFATSIGGVLARFAILIGAAASIGKIIAASFDQASAAVRQAIDIQEQFNKSLGDAGRATSIGGAIAEFRQLNGLAEQTGKSLEKSFGRNFGEALFNAVGGKPQQLAARIGSLLSGNQPIREIEANEAQQRQLSLSTLDASLNTQINNLKDVVATGGNKEAAEVVRIQQEREAQLENIVSALKAAKVSDSKIQETIAKFSEINTLEDQNTAAQKRLESEREITREKEKQAALESGTRRGNVMGRQLGPGNFDGIAELERERARRANELGPEFGPGTAEAAAGDFRVQAANFAKQQREQLEKAKSTLSEALASNQFNQLSPSDQRASVFGDANNLLQGLQDGQINPAEAAAQAVDLLRRSESLDQGTQNQFSGASSLQRVGLASNEFFTAPEEKTSKAVNEATRVITRIANLLENADPLVLER